MPFADPHSTLLDEMARRRAAYDTLRQQMDQGAAQATSALGAFGAQQQDAARYADKQKAEAADLALRQKADERAAAAQTETSALRQRAQTFEEGQAKEASALRQSQEARAQAEAAAKAKAAANADRAQKIAGAVARGLTDDEIVEAYTDADFGPDEVAAMLDEVKRGRAKQDAELAALRSRGAQRSTRGRGAAAATGAAEPLPLPKVSEAHPVVSVDAALKELGKVRQQAASIDTGPLAALGNWLAQKAGVADPDVVKFKSLVGEQVASYIKGISGATVAVEERRALLDNVPSMADDDEEFQAKLERVIDTLNTWRERELRALEMAGKGTSQFGASPVTNAPVTPAPASVPDDDRW